VQLDGAGKLTQTDFVVLAGMIRPTGQTDPETGFGIGEVGNYTVFRDCTGETQVYFPPFLNPIGSGTWFAGKFVVDNRGREISLVVDYFQVANGTQITLSCDIPAGCVLLVNISSSNRKF
jgi:hypothetical protein